MNRKVFLAGLGTFYLASGCAAACLLLKQPSSSKTDMASTATEAELVLPSPTPESEISLETASTQETEIFPETTAFAEPETTGTESAEETLEEPAETEALVSYSYRAIHQKYRLFIRESPDVSARSIGYLKPGNTGDVISVDGDWVFLEHDGITGYVSAQFLELTEKTE